MFTKDDLRNFTPAHDTFVGIDSDGCVFDTMEVKQKQFFHGKIVQFWGLEAIEPQVRRVAEFVNLYSKTRGSNRFTALLRTFELLRDWPEVACAGVALPSCQALRDYVNSGLPLGNPSLHSEAARTGDPELRRLFEWSLAVNADIDTNMPPIPPFASARTALERIAAVSDAIVVSQTPEAALVIEWRKHGLDGLVRVLAGQELGGKAEHIRLATAGRYVPDRVLLIGDSINDLKAAIEAGVLFYPISPGREEDAWQVFLAEAYDRFLNGTYAGEYQRRLTAAFDALLPDTPPWR
jgi:phosphoglycolate phosphatase-like HAD superfamily hydrolase